MPDVNNLMSYNFESNPFMDIVNSGGMGGANSGAGGGMNGGMMPGMNGGSMSQQPTQSQPMAGGEMEEEESQFNKGQNPDRGKPLLTAIQALENYIVASTDRDEILTARGIIGLLSKLVAKDQEVMMKQ